MARRISDEINTFADKLTVKTIANENIIRQTRQYRLITPLFGGGAITKKADEVKIIRETEIRGQLRFWWRAIRGGQFSSIEEMKQFEDSIFGNTEKESSVKISVSNITEESREIAYWVEERTDFYGNTKPDAKSLSKVPSYASFPLQPDKNQRKIIGWKSEEFVFGVTFQMKLEVPKVIKIENEEKNIEIEIEAMLWAWETFGGVGARTRRGFGAIELVGITGNKKNKPLDSKEDEEILRIGKFSSTDFEKFFNKKIVRLTKDFQGKGVDKDVPYISINSAYKIIPFSKSQQAWEHLIKKLKDFRQFRKMKKDVTGKLKQSISYWSEPDVIRRIVKKKISPTPSFAHPDNAHFDKLQKFPRAEFGLPIVFSFPQSNEPEVTELLPTGKTRLASPLILKPVGCSDGRAVALALILETSKDIFKNVHLFNQKKPKTDYGKVDIHLKSGEEKLIEPMKTLGETDVLKAFLKTI